MQNEFMQTLAGSMTPKFAISYLRVSTRGQAERGGGADEGFSIPAQREANLRKAHSLGAMIAKEFVDRGASARSSDRPELQKMLEYVKENQDRVDYVIVHKVDRLARNRGDDVDISRVLQEANVQLVSASESIDSSPAGMLLHGIMSSIAEFYSTNLAHEVTKGMNEKVKNGGTVSKAPIGYINIRKVDDKGREERTVMIDEERAGFIRRAFTEYATGKWTIRNLAERLASDGFATRATPKIPSSPIGRGALNKILINPYYKGMVVYNGVQYKGSHTPLVDEQTWQAVQTVLDSHYNGERTRRHPHFLRSTVYCGSCGSRMIVHYAKSRSGVRYPYYICAGRHSKRHKQDCVQKAILIEELERRVEQLYESITLPGDIRADLEAWAARMIGESQSEFEAEQANIRRNKEKLERKRLKLLEAHYNDAIPLDLLKSEQDRLGKALAELEHRINSHNAEYADLMENLGLALDLIEDCGRAYKSADEHIKRLFNQALFSRLLVNRDGGIVAEFTQPYHSLLSPIKDEVARYNAAKTNNGSKLTEYLRGMSNRVQDFFGRGLNTELLVGPQGLEPGTNRL